MRRCRRAAASLELILFGALLTLNHVEGTEPPTSGPKGTVPEVLVEAPEPRFVAPTRRDRIGRIWAPVMINGKGPFRLVLDTGANHSGITAAVAAALGLVPDASKAMLLRGVTGSQSVPSVEVETFTVGDLTLSPAILPIVTDALGGAQGVLGGDGLAGMRVFIDFRHDLISISHSHEERAPAGFVALPLEHSPSNLLVTRAEVGGVAVQAIIDTGGQATIGNEAMRAALVRRHAQGTASQVIDVTDTSQSGEAFLSPPIEIGHITIESAKITYGEMQIFEHWHLSREPALLVGMDVIGLLDVLVIDYRRHAVYMRTRAG